MTQERNTPHTPTAKKPKSSSWGSVADWYQAHLSEDADTYHAKVILPNLLRLMAPKKGLRIADIACGEGFFSRAFAAEGAEVFGSDISPELIEHAKKHALPGTTFTTAPSHRIPAAATNTFDAATIVLAIQNIRDLAGTVREAARLLKKGGALYLVLNHPVLRSPGTTFWVWDEAQQKQVRRVDAYLTEREIPIVMHPGKAGSPSTVSFHRPLQSYTKALTNNGFLIAGMEEWISHKQSQPGARAVAENAARKEFPLFLMIKAVKV